mmetsp:Transcript_56517/g.148629  ORF Transcript_56517/g.148629 Transcript_56517/m.148629 type:complete len:339 (-) Transcript_56517:1730-2746(-)
MHRLPCGWRLDGAPPGALGQPVHVGAAPRPRVIVERLGVRGHEPGRRHARGPGPRSQRRGGDVDCEHRGGDADRAGHRRHALAERLHHGLRAGRPGHQQDRDVPGVGADEVAADRAASRGGQQPGGQGGRAHPAIPGAPQAGSQPGSDLADHVRLEDPECLGGVRHHNGQGAEDLRRRHAAGRPRRRRRRGGHGLQHVHPLRHGQVRHYHGGRHPECGVLVRHHRPAGQQGQRALRNVRRGREGRHRRAGVPPLRERPLHPGHHGDHAPHVLAETCDGCRRRGWRQHARRGSCRCCRVPLARLRKEHDQAELGLSRPCQRELAYQVHGRRAEGHGRHS